MADARTHARSHDRMIAASCVLVCLLTSVRLSVCLSVCSRGMGACVGMVGADVCRWVLFARCDRKVWVPTAERPPSHQTVIIFDWDDTLLCTSYLTLRPSDELIPPSDLRHIEAIEANTMRLLTLAMTLGQVFIITNAMEGWVEYSAAKYLPRLLPILQRLLVISARHRYEDVYPGECRQWKIQAFLEVRASLHRQLIANLVSVGDSPIEMDAVHVMGRSAPRIL
eukprot:GHVU01075058.1.p1 GENE.GHVU01075058.1~~GHVU01075058.1.p1  ORF type:complete len:225 (-),score=25.28 GHVU01075058.1:100-774(-)